MPQVVTGTLAQLIFQWPVVGDCCIWEAESFPKRPGGDSLEALGPGTVRGLEPACIAAWPRSRPFLSWAMSVKWRHHSYLLIALLGLTWRLAYNRCSVNGSIPKTCVFQVELHILPVPESHGALVTSKDCWAPPGPVEPACWGPGVCLCDSCPL